MNYVFKGPKRALSLLLFLFFLFKWKLKHNVTKNFHWILTFFLSFYSEIKWKSCFRKFEIILFCCFHLKFNSSLFKIFEKWNFNLNFIIILISKNLNPSSKIFETSFLTFFKKIWFLKFLNSIFDINSRSAVVRGRVVTKLGMGLMGVRVSTTASREGFTLTRDDGWFDLMVNRIFS